MQYIEEAKQWPENLGSGKPYDNKEILEKYINAIVFEKQGKQREANALFKEISEISIIDNPLASDAFLKAWSFRKVGNVRDADELMNELLKNNPDEKSIRWCMAIYRGILGDAEKILQEPDKPIESIPYETVIVDSTFPILVWLNEELNLFTENHPVNVK